MNFRNGNLLFVFKTLTHKQVISLPLYKSNRSFVCVCVCEREREREPKNKNERKKDEKKLNEKEFVISNLSWLELVVVEDNALHHSTQCHSSKCFEQWQDCL